MSKKSRKCPNCGATVPQNTKYCRKCHTKVDSGRVETLSRPTGQAKTKTKKEPIQTARKEHDALENLPRPIRPLEGEVQQSGRRTDGFFAPEEISETAAYSGPRPVDTDREPSEARERIWDDGAAKGGDPPSQQGKGNMWQVIAVAAIVLVIIVVAVVLVIRLNEKPKTPDTSEDFEGVHVINTTTEPPAETAIPTIEPAASPNPDPDAEAENGAPPVAEATQTPEASPTATPEATEPPEEFDVTQVSDTVYVNGNGVRIRTGPGTSYDVINSESTGYELKRTGKTDNGWSRVDYKGYVGYVLDDLITTTKPAATPEPSYTVTDASGTVKVTSDANLRTGPGTEYEKVTVVTAGTELERTGTVSGWTRVKHDGRELFIYDNLITTVSSASDYTVDSDSGTLTVNTAANIRSGPGTGYSVLGVANTGETLTCTGKSGSWYRVEYDGGDGFISEGLVSKN